MVTFECWNCEKKSAKLPALVLPVGWLHVANQNGTFCIVCSEECLVDWVSKRLWKKGRVMKILTTEEF